MPFLYAAAVRRLADLQPSLPERHGLIAGELTVGEGDPLPTWYPATGELLAEVPAASGRQVDAALGAARDAFDHGPWPRMAPERRAAVLGAMADHVAARLDEAAHLVVLDNGKTASEARIDPLACVAALRSGAGAATRLTAPQPMHPDGVLRLTWREPIGVIVGITPFNAPLMFSGLKAAPALAAGNTVVLKPSPRAPLAPVLLAEAAVACGLPDGALNLVHGGTALGRQLVADPRVDMVTLTGGTAAGRAVLAAGAPRVTRALLELGGKSAHIVLADADLDAAVPAVLGGVFRNAGQRCFSGTRLLAADAVYDEVAARVAAGADALVLGDPFDGATQVGALVDADALAAVEGFVGDAVAHGAKVLAGGARAVGLPGWFHRPTVLAVEDSAHPAAQRECFGPVLTVLRVRDPEHAVAVANDSPYGLAGGVWSRDTDTALSVARRLRAGVVWVNTYAVITGDLPFGGFGQSGIGREGGAAGAEAYTELRSVLVDTACGASAAVL